MRTARRLLVLAALLALTACGEDAMTVDEADPPEDAIEQADDGQAEEPEEPTDVAASSDGEIAVASTDLGDVLVDANGMTVYVFDPDDQGPSTCYDDCAAAWPPVTTEGEANAAGGADPDLLGTTDRDDGSTQVTYDGWPLYRWAADSEPGDATGQGVNDVWWVIAPDGTPLRDEAASDDAGDDSAGLDY